MSIPNTSISKDDKKCLAFSLSTLCGLMIEMRYDQLNCKIFRCGVYKKYGKQIDTHSTKEVCDQIFKDNLIWGCGKPYMFDGTKVEICGYI